MWTGIGSGHERRGLGEQGVPVKEQSRTSAGNLMLWVGMRGGCKGHAWVRHLDSLSRVQPGVQSASPDQKSHQKEVSRFTSNGMQLQATVVFLFPITFMT